MDLLGLSGAPGDSLLLLPVVMKVDSQVRLLSILVGGDNTKVSSQDGIEILLLMPPRYFSVSGKRKRISGPWDGRLPEP